MGATARAVIVEPGGGRDVLRLNGEATSVLAGAAETRDAYAVRRNEAPPGFVSVPRHIHHHAEEAFWVISGALEVLVCERRTTLAEAGFAVIPRGTVHAIANTSDRPVRWLTLISPAAQSAWIDAEHDLIVAAEGGAPDPEALAGIHRRYGLEVVGPPPSW